MVTSLSTLADEAISSGTTEALPSDVEVLLNTYCIDCHGPDKQKGKLRLDTLANLGGEERVGLLENMHEAIRFEEMPPEDEKQPSEAERKQLDEWIGLALKSAGASNLEDKLRRPDYGNHVDHDKLFSGEYADLPGFTYDRRWLINQYIYENKINRIVDQSFVAKDYRGKRVQVAGVPNQVPNTSNPFLLPDGSGVRDYANGSFGGGAVLTMLANSEQLMPQMVFRASRNKAFLPSYSKLVAIEDEHDATLARREDFLRKHIDRLLRDIYGSRHESLLPNFVPLELPAPKLDADGNPHKRLGWDYIKPSNEVAIRTYATLRNFTATGAEVVEKCQRAWFNEGLDENSMRVRIKLVAEYPDELERLFAKQVEQQYAYQPLADAEMEIITEGLRKHRAMGDNYNQVIEKCLRAWSDEFHCEREALGRASDELLGRLMTEMFVKILEREPTSDEKATYIKLARGYLTELGRRGTFSKLLQTLMLSSEFVYRYEFGSGEADQHGRRMLSPRDAAYAISYALTEDGPDAELRKAAATGRLETREDYRREVERLLQQRDRYTFIESFGYRSSAVDSVTNIPIRKVRFFREFFGYYNAHLIFKDGKRFGHGAYVNSIGRLIVETDMLIEHILNQDRDVLETLLTTDKFYVFHSGDNEAMTKASTDRRRIYDYFKGLDWEKFTAEDFKAHADFLRENPIQWVNAEAVALGTQDMRRMKGELRQIATSGDHGGSVVPPFHNSLEAVRFYNIVPSDWDYPTEQPAKVPHRKGMLTHPAWLLAHAKNTATDPIHRGLWIREKLLAGTVPDVPITVDAVIPEDPHATLRNRLDRATGSDSCWRCHQHMNPLGLPFESFDDFGRYRTLEALEYPENLIEKTPDKGPADIRDIYKTLPVDGSGVLVGSGDPKLEGEVRDVFDLIDRLSKSDLVRQSIIRHAFRFFMGRNETLSDSKTLIDADKAYLASGGSFDALIVSLLTSDSFIYRKAGATDDSASVPSAPNHSNEK